MAGFQQRRSPAFGLLFLVVAAILGRQTWDAAFVASRSAAPSPRTPRFQSSGGSADVASDEHALQPPEVNYFASQRIADCLTEGCSVEELEDLGGRLARDSERLEESIAQLRKAQETAHSADIAETIAWVRNILYNNRELCDQLQSARGVYDSDFAKHFAGSIAFGKGQTGGYLHFNYANKVPLPSERGV
mmetsp:Transcript_42693/g.117818  ORF Transcript_42693/g.117818 Transcript_42693/m.117818 type:complete len:190 (-) Transcript_42693:170-739(-)